MSTLPEISIPAVSSYNHIYERARLKTISKKIRAALVIPTELDILAAFFRVAKHGFIEPIIIGDSQAYKQLQAEHKFDIEPKTIIDISDPELAVEKAASMAINKEIDLIVKGRMLTSDMLSWLLHEKSGFSSKEKTVSHVAVIKPQRYPKLLLVTDGGVVVQPDLKTKLNLIQNMINVSKAIGIDNPRIAVLAAVEVVYPQMPVTMEAAIISKMAERGQIKGALIDGPLSFDVSVDMFAAHSKGVKTSTVAGQADAMLAPNIETANGIYKAMALYGKCDMGGVVVGGKVPVALGSRSDTIEGKYNSIILGVLTA